MALALGALSVITTQSLAGLFWAGFLRLEWLYSVREFLGDIVIDE